MVPRRLAAASRSTGQWLGRRRGQRQRHRQLCRLTTRHGPAARGLRSQGRRQAAELAAAALWPAAVRRHLLTVKGPFLAPTRLQRRRPRSRPLTPPPGRGTLLVAGLWGRRCRSTRLPLLRLAASPRLRAQAFQCQRRFRAVSMGGVSRLRRREARRAVVWPARRPQRQGGRVQAEADAGETARASQHRVRPQQLQPPQPRLQPASAGEQEAQPQRFRAASLAGRRLDLEALPPRRRRPATATAAVAAVTAAAEPAAAALPAGRAAAAAAPTDSPPTDSPPTPRHPTTLRCAAAAEPSVAEPKVAELDARCPRRRRGRPRPQQQGPWLPPARPWPLAARPCRQRCAVACAAA